MEEDKSAARQLIFDKVLPLMQKLLRSFDPAAVDAATGNNALHEMGSMFNLDRADGWPYKLFQSFIDRGVSVHTRNKEGRTPLLLWAAAEGENVSTANGLLPLLAHGADLNSQDSEGNGVIHHLALCGAEARLNDLLAGGGVAHLDHALRNNAGQTAVDLAAIRLAEQADISADCPQKRIHRLLVAHTELWVKRARPLLLLCLDLALPVADVAKLALGYIDGSGLPFTAVAEADEQAEPAAAAAAAAAQS